jgi:inhibitor of cysteine peptidase
METKRDWYRAAAGAVAIVLLLALIASAASGCASANATGGPLELAQSDNGKTFTVKVGDTIEVVLPGNVTTGFSWIAALGDADAALLVQEGDAVYVEQSSDEQVVGAGGTFTFRFKAAATGEATLTLAYEKPWEKVAPEQTFEVHVTVE